MNKVKLIVSNAYGRTHHYPDCKLSRLFASLSKKPTLTKEEIEMIKIAGIEVEIEGKK